MLRVLCWSRRWDWETLGWCLAAAQWLLKLLVLELSLAVTAPGRWAFTILDLPEGKENDDKDVNLIRVLPDKMPISPGLSSPCRRGKGLGGWW